jgi:hypothetical protein
MSAESFKQSGNKKFAEKDYEGAIADYTTAIIKNPNVTISIGVLID